MKQQLSCSKESGIASTVRYIVRWFHNEDKTGAYDDIPETSESLGQLCKDLEGEGGMDQFEITDDNGDKYKLKVVVVKVST